MKVLFADTGMTWLSWLFHKTKCPGIISVFHFAKCRNGTETWGEKRHIAEDKRQFSCSWWRRHFFSLYLSNKAVWRPCGLIWHLVIRLIMFPAGWSPSNLSHRHTTPCDCNRTFLLFLFSVPFFFQPLNLRIIENRTPRMQKRPNPRGVGKSQKKKNEWPDGVFCKYYDKGFQE